MVNARLHIICGNCGSKDYFAWEYVPEDEEEDADVNLYCNNCVTIHQISSNAKPRTPTGN